MKKQTTINITEQEYLALQNISDEKRVPMSQVLSELIRAFIVSGEPTPKYERSKSGTGWHRGFSYIIPDDIYKWAAPQGGVVRVIGPVARKVLQELTETQFTN